MMSLQKLVKLQHNSENLFIKTQRKKYESRIVKLSCECPMWTQGLPFVITYTGKPGYYL